MNMIMEVISKWDSYQKETGIWQHSEAIVTERRCVQLKIVCFGNV